MRYFAVLSFLFLSLLALLADLAILVKGLAAPVVSRRQALIETTAAAAATTGALWTPQSSLAIESASLSSISPNVSVRLSSSASSSSSAANPPSPPRDVQIPRVGYSLYKTASAQVETGVALALTAGVRHFDCATQYGTNAQVGSVLRHYIAQGRGGIEQDANNDKSGGSNKNNNNNNNNNNRYPIPRTAARRRQELFVTHKLSNEEQSLSKQDLQTSVLFQRDLLLGKTKDQDAFSHLNFMAMIHSPLTDKERRLKSYAALVELQQQNQVGAVGVCHYGVSHLEEIRRAGMPAPQVIQLVLSPFHPHADVAAWAQEHGSILACAPWSKLSSTQGPQQGWAKLGELAARRGVTKQQVLIRWAVQKGFLCAPRSGAQYKVERAAIVENAWPSIRDFVLTPDDMSLLDGLDEQLPAGQLGVVDGWEASDIVNDKWDPTLLKV